MKVVLDESVSLAVGLRLRELGHEVTAIAEGATTGMRDEEVFALARQDRALLITRDRGLARTLRFPPSLVSAVFYIRPGNLTSEEEVALVERFLGTHDRAEYEGALVTLYKDSVRIRR